MENILKEVASRIKTMREIREIDARTMAEATGVTVEAYLALEEGKVDFTFTFIVLPGRTVSGSTSSSGYFLSSCITRMWATPEWHSAFGAFSACPTTHVASLTAATLNAHKDLPVRMFYNICGTGDNIAHASATAAVKNLSTLTDQLNDKNFIVQDVPGGHGFTVWYLGFYNFARMIGEE